MIIATVLAAALVAAGCNAKPPAPEAGMPESAAPSTPGESSSQAALRIFPANREVALTAPDAKDVVEAHVVGAGCEQAVLLLTLRKAGGRLLVPFRARNGYVGFRSSIGRYPSHSGRGHEDLPV